jgi:hypothetical protein
MPAAPLLSLDARHPCVRADIQCYFMYTGSRRSLRTTFQRSAVMPVHQCAPPAQALAAAVPKNSQSMCDAGPGASPAAARATKPGSSLSVCGARAALPAAAAHANRSTEHQPRADHRRHPDHERRANHDAAAEHQPRADNERCADLDAAAVCGADAPRPGRQPDTHTDAGAPGRTLPTANLLYCRSDNSPCTSALERSSLRHCGAGADGIMPYPCRESSKPTQLQVVDMCRRSR